MTARFSVVLVTKEPQTASAVASALNAGKSAVEQHTCRDLAELADHLEKSPASAVLVDIDGEPEKTLAELDRAVSRYESARFIVIASELRQEWVLAAMQAGARQFVVKKSIATDLAIALERVLRAGRVREVDDGGVVTVLCASGGCGGTTLAVNLANELHLISGQETLLVDLDISYGGVAGYLGLTGDYGLADVLADGDRIDGELIKSTAMAHNGDLHVLLSPASVNLLEPAILQYQHLRRALAGFKRAYRFAVVDAPRVPIDVAAILAEASVRTLVVFELNVVDVRVARAIIGGLIDRGVAADSIVPLANRFRKRGLTVSLADAEKALGGIPARPLCNDFTSAVAGINFGRPLADAAPRSLLRKEIRALAEEFAKIQSRPANPVSPGALR